jgi:predicted nucleic acid-binding protein
MSDLVVDSSVAVKWFLPEPDSPKAVQVRNEVITAGGRLIVLDLVLAEVTNAIWNKHRQMKITILAAQQALADLQGFPMQRESAARLLDDAFDIAVKYDRAVYDALFVALAQDLGVKGVTSDEPLYNTTHADFPQIVLLRDWP